MKAVLQVGPAQFVVDGATFHLLCEDIIQTLKSLMTIDESDISLTLNTDALERCFADDAQRLAAAGVPLPRSLAGANEEIVRSDEKHMQSPPPRRLCMSCAVPKPMNIFSSDSFDAAEAVVQEMLARVLDQRLQLEKCVQGTASREVELQELGRGGSSGGSRCAALLPQRAVPLPLLRLGTYLSTSVNMLPDYDAQGRRRCNSSSVIGTSSNPL
ncbi:hypothetical protein ABL78_1319 [Leptomonas seymouri]|uniref:Uncharacterized protein n=1 Tax=Leptomonas seymouri TaxID=5684 RepID=A0A0N1PE19_LEPSE|nr:hypothetical protein ABL78_1319 [Leptomonas seymouri]|eukprot:KPI89551.1 hypothetical protein ABL78_1319 [Leptomonas seymouri]